ncbi:MAG TPA: MBL fold metallo-hydrolase [Steroidobacteraceae bacterium]|nr:MBL fold metallo-hydrolase [Steroidobacteraceae bacterium]
MPQATVIRHPDGITAVDTDYIRPGLAAAHVIEHAGRAAFVDVGTNHSVPRLLDALEQLGIAPSAVDFVFLTHVHLDHAGGAGALLRELPNARAVVHPRGAPHLAEPSKLIAASIAVYGEALYRSLYGDLVPVPRERMILMQDEARIDLAGRELRLLNTPGHALHHYCILDVARANVFTGDTLGLSYRELDTAAGALVLPTTTPTQFDPEQLVASIRRLLAYSPQAAYLMHYSRVTGLARIAESLETQIRDLASMARRHANDADRDAGIRAEMQTMWLALARRHGVTLPEARIVELLDKDLELNTQGLLAWLDRASRVSG